MKFFRYVPEFLENRQATIVDIVEKSLKRGKGAEVQAAANLALLLGLQLLDAQEVSFAEEINRQSCLKKAPFLDLLLVCLCVRVDMEKNMLYHWLTIVQYILFRSTGR